MFKVGDIVRLKEAKRTSSGFVNQLRASGVDFEHLTIRATEYRGGSTGDLLLVHGAPSYGCFADDLEHAGGPW